MIGTPLINYFARKQITGPIRQDGPIDHIIKKSGTPTMGGVIIIIGIISGTILWADLTNIYVWTLIFVSLSLGGLGLLDDVLKINELCTKVFFKGNKNLFFTGLEKQLILPILNLLFSN